MPAWIPPDMYMQRLCPDWDTKGSQGMFLDTGVYLSIMLNVRGAMAWFWLIQSPKQLQVINMAQKLLAIGSVCATITFCKAKAEQVPEGSYGHV